jgi:hypothetical protein
VEDLLERRSTGHSRNRVGIQEASGRTHPEGFVRSQPAAVHSLLEEACNQAAVRIPVVVCSLEAAHIPEEAHNLEAALLPVVACTPEEVSPSLREVAEVEAAVRSLVVVPLLLHPVVQAAEVAFGQTRSSSAAA